MQLPSLRENQSNYDIDFDLDPAIRGCEAEFRRGRVGIDLAEARRVRKVFNVILGTVVGEDSPLDKGDLCRPAPQAWLRITSRPNRKSRVAQSY